MYDTQGNTSGRRGPFLHGHEWHHDHAWAQAWPGHDDERHDHDHDHGPGFGRGHGHHGDHDHGHRHPGFGRDGDPRGGRRRRGGRFDWDLQGPDDSGRRGPGEVDPERMAFRQSIAGLLGAARQYRRATPLQRAAAYGILDEARRALYRVLAESPATTPSETTGEPRSDGTVEDTTSSGQPESAGPQ